MYVRTHARAPDLHRRRLYKSTREREIIAGVACKSEKQSCKQHLSSLIVSLPASQAHLAVKSPPQHRTAPLHQYDSVNSLDRNTKSFAATACHSWCDARGRGKAEGWRRGKGVVKWEPIMSSCPRQSGMVVVVVTAECLWWKQIRPGQSCLVVVMVVVVWSG